jgi:hypothetical protein
MKLFGRTSGYYLFWTGFIYFCIGMLNIKYEFTSPEFIQIVWIVVMALPLTVKPIADYFNMKRFWE